MFISSLFLPVNSSLVPSYPGFSSIVLRFSAMSKNQIFGSCRHIKGVYDTHPSCINCTGCGEDDKCPICQSWPESAWAAFRKRRTHKGRRSKSSKSSSSVHDPLSDSKASFRAKESEEASSPESSGNVSSSSSAGSVQDSPVRNSHRSRGRSRRRSTPLVRPVLHLSLPGTFGSLNLLKVPTILPILLFSGHLMTGPIWSRLSRMSSLLLTGLDKWVIVLYLMTGPDRPWTSPLMTGPANLIAGHPWIGPMVPIIGLPPVSGHLLTGPDQPLTGPDLVLTGPDRVTPVTGHRE